MDVDRWVAHDKPPCKHFFTSLNWFLTYRQEFRNLFLHRLKNPSRTLLCWLHYCIGRILWRPLNSLYLNTEDIGGGLYIQHGFSTIVSAHKVGENCWINQQVTIGYTKDGYPVIGDNVTVYCGAKIVGDVTMHNNSTAGAGAVVVHDVPENAVVGGVPAKVISINSQ